MDALTYEKLHLLGIPLPEGFVIDAAVFAAFLKHNHLDTKLLLLLQNLDQRDPNHVLSASELIKNLFSSAQFPNNLDSAVLSDFRRHISTREVEFSTFSPTSHNFYEVTKDNFLLTLQNHWATLYGPQNLGNSVGNVSPSVLVRSHHSPEVSGTVIKDKNKITITALWGLHNPATISDCYEFDVSRGELTFRQISHQQTKIARFSGEEKPVFLDGLFARAPKLDLKQIKTLAALTLAIHRELYFPQKIHFIVNRGHIFITDVFPHTPEPLRETVKFPKVISPLGLGIGHFPGIKTGHLRKIKNSGDLKSIAKSDIIFSSFYHPELSRSSALILEKPPSDKEFGEIKRAALPTISGVSPQVFHLKSDQIVTVNGKTGEVFLGRNF